MTGREIRLPGQRGLNRVSLWLLCCSLWIEFIKAVSPGDVFVLCVCTVAARGSLGIGRGSGEMAERPGSVGMAHLIQKE